MLRARPPGADRPGVARKWSRSIARRGSRVILEAGHAPHAPGRRRGRRRCGSRPARRGRGQARTKTTRVPRHRPKRPAAMAGRDPRHAEQHQRRPDEEPGHETTTGRPRRGRGRAADRVGAASRRRSRRSRSRRPVDGESRPRGARRSRTFTSTSAPAPPRRTTASTAAREWRQQGGDGDDDEQLEGGAGERAHADRAAPSGATNAAQRSSRATTVNRDGDAVTRVTAVPGARAAHVHWPNDAASRAEQAYQRIPCGGRQPGCSDRQHDALRRRDEPAQRRAAAAGIHAAGRSRAGEEQVARGADRETTRRACGRRRR